MIVTRTDIDRHPHAGICADSCATILTSTPGAQVRLFLDPVERKAFVSGRVERARVTTVTASGRTTLVRLPAHTFEGDDDVAPSALVQGF